VTETFKAKTAQLEYEERAGKLIQATKAGEYAANWSAIVVMRCLRTGSRGAAGGRREDGSGDSPDYWRARPTRCAARWRRQSRTRVTDGHAILHVQGPVRRRCCHREISRCPQWADENVVLTGSGSAERASGTPDPTARADGCPQPEPSVQAGGVDERGPDVEDQCDGQLPGIHRGRRSGADAGGGTAI